MSHAACIHLETRQSRCFKMMRVVLTFVTFCILLIRPSTTTDATEQPTVQTTLGSIQGKLVKVPENRPISEVYEFIGIPYAQPPVGKLRFKKPEPVQPWNGIYEATTWSNMCVQSTVVLLEMLNMSLGNNIGEDCLYLNIWSPYLPTAKAEPNRAVMVYLHGGAFELGSASQSTYHGAILSSMGDVVMVTINYRLGVLGFLNLGIEEAPGNQGLWDQRMALMWVQKHIEHFGGDPNRVTIFGESSGSVSAGVFLSSPVSQGLFHRAIMQSGSPNILGFLNNIDQARESAMQYAVKQGCSDQSNITDESTLLNIITCLRQLEVSQIIEESDQHRQMESLKMKPTYGDEFFPNKERNTSSEWPTIDLMIGTTTNEGSMFLKMILDNMQRNQNETVTFTVKEAKTISKAMLAFLIPNIIDEAVRFYFQRIPETTSDYTLKQMASHLPGDAIMTCPSVFFAEYFAMENPVYYYQFNYRRSDGPFEEWTGVVHAEELQYIFQHPLFPKVSDTQEEIEFGREMVEIWTSFAKTGKPNAPGMEEWPRYSENHPVYVDLKPSNYTKGIGPRLQACNFWRCHMTKP